MITKDKIRYRKMTHEDDPDIPKDVIELHAVVTLRVVRRMPTEAVPQYRKELMDALEFDVKRSLLINIYGDAARQVYAIRHKVMMTCPSYRIDDVIEDFNKLLDALPCHEVFSLPKEKQELPLEKLRTE